MHPRHLALASLSLLLGVTAWSALSLVQPADAVVAPAGAAAAPETTPSPSPVQAVWAPPAWLRAADGPVSAWSLADLDGAPLFESGPKLRSHAAFIADLDRGEVLYARRPDEMVPVASLTKLVSALALASERLDLDASLCVNAEHYPTRSGARSRFETGACHPGWDWLGAALVASDNRGAMGLHTLSQLDYDAFVERMHEVSAELGLKRAEWADPSGIEVGNRASARDMARATVAVAAHPLLSAVASAPSWQMARRGGLLELGSTNRLVRRFETLAAKTGYTDPARYCFSQVVRAESGATYVTVVLGAPTTASRFDDSQRLVAWAEGLR